MTRPLLGWTIVLDLDGTLVDTAPDLLGALNHVLAGDGLAPVDLDTIHAIIGEGANAMLRRGYAFHGRALDEADAEPRWRAFIDHYTANIAVESRPFEGAEAALDALSAQGATLSVCTNKLQGLAEEVLDALSLAPRFAAVVGADAVPARKPDPGHVLEAVARAGGTPERAIFVGDSRTDEKAARNAGLPFIFVPFGYEAATADDIDAAAIVRHYKELVSSVLAIAA